MHMQLLPLLLLHGLCALVVAQGDMHPSIGMPAGCRLNVTNDCAPTYAALANASKLWACPAGTKSAHSTWPDQCVTGNDPTGNPLCPGKLTDADPCCCPKQGCYAEPKFNTIIGVCQGASCACGSSSTRAPSCAPQGDADRCGSMPSQDGDVSQDRVFQLSEGHAHGQTAGSWSSRNRTAAAGACTGESVACCFGANVERLVPFYDAGTRATVNYLAAYQYDEAAGHWVQQPESSFNADGALPPFDLMKPYGGLPKEQAWLAPQPGGAVYWAVGYYAAGVAGVGAPGAMWVMSTEEWWGGTWYMLNQLELDRGPAVPYAPSDACRPTDDNCWAAGNAGEMDFLEPAWQSGKASDPSVSSDYRAAYATQNNQIGRMFNGGVNTGGFASSNYLLTGGKDGGEPVVYVAVVDKVGNWVYRIPADEAAAIWPGIGRKKAAPTVTSAPAKRPTSMNPCTTDFCATFTSNCQATNVSAARAQNCPFNGDQGFCGNWFSPFADTHQPLFPSDDCERDVRGGVTMPWCVEMVP